MKSTVPVTLIMFDVRTPSPMSVAPRERMNGQYVGGGMISGFGMFQPAEFSFSSSRGRSAGRSDFHWSFASSNPFLAVSLFFRVTIQSAEYGQQRHEIQRPAIIHMNIPPRLRSDWGSSFQTVRINRKMPVVIGGVHVGGVISQRRKGQQYPQDHIGRHGDKYINRPDDR